MYGHSKFYFASLYSVLRKPHITIILCQQQFKLTKSVLTHMVLNMGLEPIRLSTLWFEHSASANSANRAYSALQKFRTLKAASPIPFYCIKKSVLEKRSNFFFHQRLKLVLIKRKNQKKKERLLRFWYRNPLCRWLYSQHSLSRQAPLSFTTITNNRGHQLKSNKHNPVTRISIAPLLLYGAYTIYWQYSAPYLGFQQAFNGLAPFSPILYMGILLYKLNRHIIFWDFFSLNLHIYYIIFFIKNQIRFFILDF